MKDSIKYVKFRPDNQPELLPKVVSCYREVFADPPWNEWKVCPKCGKHWGSLAKLKLEECKYTHCSQPLKDFWPEYKVEFDIRHEVSNEASCWLALDENKVVGFCWGYPIGLKEISQKLELSVLPGVVNQQFSGVTKVAYQDEIGVLSEYRRQGIGKTLFEARLSDFKNHELRVGLVRTKTKPPTVTYIWYHLLSYRVIAEYGDLEGRVVMAGDLASIRKVDGSCFH